MSAPNIAIIGAGNVGASLGGRLVDSGYAVTYGVRDDDAATRAQERVHPDAELAPLRDAAAEADVIFLAVPAAAALDAARALGELDGKILVDCVNPIRWDAGPVWDPPAQGSMTQALAASARGVRAVKGFNTFGAEFHADPSLGGDPVDVQLASDDAQAKTIVSEIAMRAGFRPVDAGPLRNAAVLENLAVLWIHLATVGGRGRNFAFSLRER